VSFNQHIVTLFILAIPVACIAWIFTHEAVLREFQESVKFEATAAVGWSARFFIFLPANIA